MATFIHRLFHNSTAPSHVKHVAVDRMTGDPGLPAAMPTRSFWLTADPDMNTDGAESALSGVSQAIAPPARLPETAEVAILGSGITGTSVARTLLRDGGLGDSSVGRVDSGVVMLDAREPCGGATGRNGGHITEIGFGDYSELKTAVGQEEAMKIIRFRLVHLDTLLAVAKEEGLIEIGQVRRVVTATVIYDETVWEETKKALATFKEDFGEEAAEWQLVDSKRGLKEYGVETAHGLVLNRAGAAWPARFVTGLLSNLARTYPCFTIAPFTPVTLIIRCSTTGRFLLTTARGTLSVKHVVHATNAHIAHLVPGLRGRIYPLRGQMSAQTILSSNEKKGSNGASDQTRTKEPELGGRTSWSFVYPFDFGYLTQLPRTVLPPPAAADTHYSSAPVSIPARATGGEMMYGGGLAQASSDGIDEIGVAADDALNAAVTAHLRAGLSRAFVPDSSTTSSSPPPSPIFAVRAMWTGIMGFTADGLPWIGQLPASTTGRTGPTGTSGQSTTTGTNTGAEWAAAGFSGEGMVHTWLAGSAVALMVLGRGRETAAWLPDAFLISEERVRECWVRREELVEDVPATGAKM